MLPDILRPHAAAPGQCALCLDFDGTLSAIVDDPVAARPWPGVPALLEGLAHTFAVVAVISGRPVQFLHDVLGGPAGVRLVGLYGLERRNPADGRRQVVPEAQPFEAVMADIVERARAEAPAGVYVEPKGLTLTLHWRHAPDEQSWVEQFVQREVATRELQVHRGRMELELRPPLAVDKGTVVRELTRGMQAMAIFGDDIGDLPGFAAAGALRQDGVAVARIAVVDAESNPAVAAEADLTVDGPAGALALLETLLEAARPRG
ncbi:MAG TPA: trehalose-phosphatase [Acidimicrobiales bacterium]|nr:trehalose-phosphatase [Acidimicrobiales bacterium]